MEGRGKKKTKKNKKKDGEKEIAGKKERTRDGVSPTPKGWSPLEAWRDRGLGLAFVPFFFFFFFLVAEATNGFDGASCAAGGRVGSRALALGPDRLTNDLRRPDGLDGLGLRLG